MILVDTSVLIDVLRNKHNLNTEKFYSLEEKNIPFGITPLIYQEVLQGASNEKTYQSLKEYFSTQNFYFQKDSIEESENAAKIYFNCRREGLTIRSTIDCLIAQTCLTHNLFLLHNDSDFIKIQKIAKDLKFY